MASGRRPDDYHRVYTLQLAALLTAVFFLAAFWAAYPLWLTPNSAYTRIRLACIGLIVFVSTFYLVPQYIPVIINHLVIPSINQYMGLHLPPIDLSPPPFWILLIDIAGIAIIVRSLPDQPIMRPSARSSNDDTDQQYKRDFLAFAELWLHRLNVIDRETSWSNQDFVSLDAEVEIHSLDKNQRRVGDLIRALRIDSTDNPILILGEPGSGKSVALRRLCRELLKETSATGRLPLYINLKNWISSTVWNEAVPPTTAELKNYIHAYLHREADDVFADRFLRKNFDSMLKRGTIFFILDFFDEIPAVMDSSENSWIIETLSDVIGKFLRGAHASRGIVASRYFKRPTDRLAAGSVYRIKPFDDARIQKVLTLVGMRTDEQVRDVFRLRPDLVSAATNPLIANLLATFVREHGGEWPCSKLALFNDYIQRQLSDQAVVLRMEEYGVTSAIVIVTTIAIASTMTKSEVYGLEIPVHILVAQLSPFPTNHILQILKFARLGRISTDVASNFSFAHRRFQEFFVVVEMLVTKAVPDVASIISDTRYRDILALYGEVADAEGANTVAIHCWNQIESRLPRWRADDGDRLEVVQALRFLTEAFRSRRDFTDSFRNDLATYIRGQLEHFSYRPFTAKFASEAIGLLDDDRAGALFPCALAYRSAYVRETAFRSCRHLVAVSDATKKAALTLILRYRHELLLGTALIRHHRELRFSLSISDSFRSVRRMEGAWVADACIFAGCLGVLFLLSPIVVICVVASREFWYRNAYGGAGRLQEEVIRQFRKAEVFISTGLVACVCVYLFGLGWALGFSSWWPSNPLFLWEKPLQASVLVGDDGGWIIPAYKWLVALCIVGLFPVVPMIVQGWATRHQIVSQISRMFRRAKSDSATTHSNYETSVPRRSPYDQNAWEIFTTAITNMPRKERMVALGIFLGSVFVGSALYFVWSLLGGRTILIVASCGIGTLLLYRFGRAIWRRFLRETHDKRVLQSCRITAVMQRQQIQEMLDLLKGEGARMKFIRALLANHVAAVGAWRDGRPPFQPNDRISDELIRLEERWLRLDG